MTADLIMDRAMEPITYMRRLPMMWAGPGSVQPNRAALDQAEYAARSLPRAFINCEWEIDDGDGSMSAIWKDNRHSFMVTFMPGCVIGTLAPQQQDYPAWKVSGVAEIACVRERLFHPIVWRLMHSDRRSEG